MTTRGGWSGLRVAGQPFVLGSPQPPGPCTGASIRYSIRPSPSRSPSGTSHAEVGRLPLLLPSPAPRTKNEPWTAPGLKLKTTGRPGPWVSLMIGTDVPEGQAAWARPMPAKAAHARITITLRDATRRSGRLKSHLPADRTVS